jgi:hypothetical protein
MCMFPQSTNMISFSNEYFFYSNINGQLEAKTSNSLQNSNFL